MKPANAPKTLMVRIFGIDVPVTYEVNGATVLATSGNRHEEIPLKGRTPEDAVRDWMKRRYVPENPRARQ